MLATLCIHIKINKRKSAVKETERYQLKINNTKEVNQQGKYTEDISMKMCVVLTHTLICMPQVERS